MVCVSRGVFLEGYKQSAFGSFLMSHPMLIWGRAATGIDLGEEDITGNGTVFGQRGL